MSEKTTIFVTFVFAMSLLAFACKQDSSSHSDSSKETKKSENSFGVGPIQSKIELGAIDNALVKKGEQLFQEKCTACHKINERYVGPPIKGVTKRRSPEWIMNMILDPVKMTQEDPQAKALLAEYLTQMTNQHVSKDDARAILEYFRSIDSQK